MPEDGTLSILRQGQRYQIRYAPNNPHGQERLPWMYPDETQLAALLHHLGTEAATETQVCTTVRHGQMAILLVVVTAMQLHPFFPPTSERHRWQPATDGTCGLT